jgi:hypothetical protein
MRASARTLGCNCPILPDLAPSSRLAPSSQRRRIDPLAQARGNRRNAVKEKHCRCAPYDDGAFDPAKRRMRMMRIFAAAAVLGAVLIAAPAAALTVETDQPWCGDVDGAKECVYPTLKECERWMQPEGQACVPNPRG